MKPFARFKNEIWCMNLAYVDKLSKNFNSVKYLPDRQDMFDRAADAKGMKMKTKDSNGTVRAFLTMTTERKWPKNVWVHMKTEFAGEFQKFYKAEVIQIYSTMSSTKAAFAERTIRSLKKLYCYMEDRGQKLHLQTVSIRHNTDFQK